MYTHILIRYTILLLLSLSFSVGDLKAREKPNIIFIFIDDMGFGDLGCYGNEMVSTPHIDQLAAQGLRFTQFYVNAPICSPSRVAVLTGQYPGRWGITTFISNRKHNEERGINHFLAADAPSLARKLDRAGYYTAHIGKWHMGGGRDVGDAPLISEYGFDESVTQFEGLGERYLATYETLENGDTTRGLERMSATLGRGEVHWKKRHEISGIFVDRTISAIEKAQALDQPFYINLWPDDVHMPLEPSPALRGNGSLQELYHGVIYELDRQLGRLFDYVRQNSALADNTLIILASDNGPSHRVGSTNNLRGHKGNLYEGGIRVPFVVWYPGKMPGAVKGAVNDRTVIAGIDLLPSLLQITEVKDSGRKDYDGTDMSRAMTGLEQPLREKAMMWQRPPGVEQFEGHKNPDLAIREGDFKLIVNSDGSNPQLFNIVADRGEQVNVVDRFPDVYRRMSRKVLKWYNEMTNPK